jgi:hypothetical protein
MCYSINDVADSFSSVKKISTPHSREVIAGLLMKERQSEYTDLQKYR